MIAGCRLIDSRPPYPFPSPTVIGRVKYKKSNRQSAEFKIELANPDTLRCRRKRWALRFLWSLWNCPKLSLWNYIPESTGISPNDLQYSATREVEMTVWNYEYSEWSDNSTACSMNLRSIRTSVTRRHEIHSFILFRPRNSILRQCLI